MLENAKQTLGFVINVVSYIGQRNLQRSVVKMNKMLRTKVVRSILSFPIVFYITLYVGCQAQEIVLDEVYPNRHKSCWWKLK